MVTHVPMAVHPNVKNVLIIGGGDGGVARELITLSKRLRALMWWNRIKCLWMYVRRYFPDIAHADCKDERVNVYYEDGLRFLRKQNRP